MQSGRRKKGKTIVFFEVYELARISTNWHELHDFQDMRHRI